MTQNPDEAKLALQNVSAYTVKRQTRWSSFHLSQRNKQRIQDSTTMITGTKVLGNFSMFAFRYCIRVNVIQALLIKHKDVHDKA